MSDEPDVSDDGSECSLHVLRTSKAIQTYKPVFRKKESKMKPAKRVRLMNPEPEVVVISSSSEDSDGSDVEEVPTVPPRRPVLPPRQAVAAVLLPTGSNYRSSDRMRLFQQRLQGTVEEQRRFTMSYHLRPMACRPMAYRPMACRPMAFRPIDIMTPHPMMPGVILSAGVVTQMPRMFPPGIHHDLMYTTARNHLSSLHYNLWLRQQRELENRRRALLQTQSRFVPRAAQNIRIPNDNDGENDQEVDNGEGNNGNRNNADENDADVEDGEGENDNNDVIVIHEANQNAMQGLPPDDIEGNSVSFIYEEIHRVGSQAICVICISKFCVGETLRRLCCYHVFHRICIDKWLQDNISCPICRSALIDIEENE